MANPARRSTTERAGPPFNIGYDHDIYDDHRSAGQYLNWTKW
jgi:hypothetical protein